MSAAWPWVILGRVPRVTTLPGEAEADFSIRVAPPPQVTVLTVGPLAHPDPNNPDQYPYILAAGPDCLLLSLGTKPFSGVNSAFGSVRTYLIVARQFRTTAGVQQGHAAAPLGERIPARRKGDIPVPHENESVGLVAPYDGDYTVAELEVDKGAEHATLFRFRAGGGDVWTRNDLGSPLASEDRQWVPAGVVAQKTTLWWFDLSWGLLSCDCDPLVDDPVLLFHKLPEDRALDMPPRPDSDIHTRRCVTVSRRELRYVEIIIPEDGLVDVPWPAPESCRYAVQAWNLPPWVAVDLDLVGFSSSDEDADQAEELDEEELLKLGLKVAMGMDPSTLKSEVNNFYDYEGPPSPEREVMMQLHSERRVPFYFPLTDKEVDEDLMKVRDHVMKKHRLGK